MQVLAFVFLSVIALALFAVFGLLVWWGAMGIGAPAFILSALPASLALMGVGVLFEMCE